MVQAVDLTVPTGGSPLPVKETPRVMDEDQQRDVQALSSSAEGGDNAAFEQTIAATAPLHPVPVPPPSILSSPRGTGSSEVRLY